MIEISGTELDQKQQYIGNAKMYSCDTMKKNGVAHSLFLPAKNYMGT